MLFPDSSAMFSCPIRGYCGGPNSVSPGDGLRQYVINDIIYEIVNAICLIHLRCSHVLSGDTGWGPNSVSPGDSGAAPNSASPCAES
jgi:hypothetical protein